MGCVYLKPDQKDPKKLRWYGKASLPQGGHLPPISLKLRGPRNEREARARLRELEGDLEDGKLRARTRAWMTERAIKEAEGVLSGRSEGRPGDDVGTLCDLYLVACETKDSQVAPKGKIKTRNLVKTARSYWVRTFVAWMQRERGGSIPRDISTPIAEFLGAEVKRGLAPVTVRRGYAPYLFLFADWLHRRGCCDPVDRAAVRHGLPDVPPPEVKLPGWRDDLAAIRGVYSVRLSGPTEWSAWCLLVVVRGLGCRPSEAYSLAWDTVDLAPGLERVRFLATKNGSNRTAPVLYQWVLGGLSEMKARGGKAGSPVCPNRQGNAWSCSSSANLCLLRACVKSGVAAPHLKELQKLAIMQMVRDGFPPHAVACWTGHTLSVQERHYLEEDAYLPTEPRDYAETGALCAHGRATLSKLAPGRGNRTG